MRFIKIINNKRFTLLSIFLFLYVIFNLIDGERGLFSYIKKKEILTNLQQSEKDYINKIEDLEFKTLY